MGSIHPLALVSPQARVGPGCVIGPFCVVEADVELGPGCVLESHVVIKQGSRVGANNHFHEGAIIGGTPQHVRHAGPFGTVEIGSGNTIREHVTIHRALHPGDCTRVGNNNYLMINVHIAHDCQVGSQTIMANNVMLAGHVSVEDGAYLSGAVAVHQYCRIGTLAMVGGQAHVNKDVPPFVTVDGLSSLVVGLNTIGLRRHGFSTQEIALLKQAYRLIYCSGLSWEELLRELKAQFPQEPACRFWQFLEGSSRGILNQRRVPRTTTIRLPQPETDQTQRRMAG